MNSSVIIFFIVAIALGYLVFNYMRMRNTALVPDSEKIITLTDANLGHEIRSGVYLVDFWASWCVPCKVMAPILNDLAEEDSAKFRIGKVNIEQYPGAASKYSVRNIPTLIIFKDGKEMKRIVGVKPKEYLKKQVETIQ